MPHSRPRSLAFLLLLATASGLGCPSRAESQVVTRADSAAVLTEAAASFEAEGRWEVAEALYEYVVSRFGDTPAAVEARALLARVSVSQEDRSGRVELQVWTTTYGLWLGVAIPGALGAEEPEPYGLGLLAGGPLGFLAGRSLARDRPLSEGQVRAITLGGTWGTWQGFGWAEVLDIGEEGEVCELDYCYYDGDNGRELLTSAIVGGLAGIGTGLVLSKKPISRGLGTIVNFGALWGTWFGFAGAVLADLEDDALLAGTLVGGDAGLLATSFLGPKWNLSRNRARLISIAGVIGGLGGAGLDLLFQPEGEKVAVGIPLVTSMLGLVVGANLTKGEDTDRHRGSVGPEPAGAPQSGRGIGANPSQSKGPSKGPGPSGRSSPLDPFGLPGSLLRLRDGRLDLGLPAPFPTLLPVDGPRGSRWELGMGVTLLRAAF